LAESVVYSFRLTGRQVERLKEVAAYNHIGPTVLARYFVVRGITEEEAKVGTFDANLDRIKGHVLP
jgi:hypothetical protein